MKRLKLLLPYLLRYKKAYGIGVVFILVQNYGYLKFPEYLKEVISELTGANRAEQVYWLLAGAFFYLGVTVVFMYLMRLLIIGASRKIEYEMRRQLFAHLMSLSVKFYQKEQTGDLISRITNDLNDVRTLLGPGLMYVPNSLTRLGFFVPVMFLISPQLLWAIILLVAVLLFLILVLIPKMRPLFRRIQEQRANLNNHAWQLLSAIGTVKLNTMEATETKKFDAHNQRYIKSNLRLAWVEGFTWPLFYFVFSLSQALMLYLGGSQIIKGVLTLEELLQFNVMIGVMTFPIFSLGWVISIIQQGIAALERINRILSQSSEEEQRTKTLSASPLSLSAKQISYYGDNGNALLENISLEIKPKEMIGIAGKTGSGKTILLELLVGLYQPHKGEVFIGGTPLAEVAPESLYRRIAFVPQEAFLFSAPIKQNIGFQDGTIFDFNRVVSSAVVSDIDKDINTFPQQYSQLVGERGITLSGGQKQRATISRAVYKEAEILILDDSLSSVDSQTEENIITNLKALKHLKTIVVVSQKISILKLTDRIYFLKEGRLAEQGTHKALMRANQAYARMAKFQQLSSISKQF